MSIEKRFKFDHLAKLFSIAKKRFAAVKLIFIAQILLKSNSEFYFGKSSTNLIVVNYVLKMISQLNVSLLFHPHLTPSYSNEPLLIFPQLHLQCRTPAYDGNDIRVVLVPLERREIIINLIVTNIASSRSFYVPH